MKFFTLKSKKELWIKKDQIGSDKMFSYLPTFDWNNGQEIDPFGWLFEDDRAKLKPRTKTRSIKIKR